MVPSNHLIMVYPKCSSRYPEGRCFQLICAFYTKIALISHRALCYPFSVTIPHERSIGAQLQKCGTAPTLPDYAALLGASQQSPLFRLSSSLFTLFASQNELLLMFWRSKASIFHAIMIYAGHLRFLVRKRKQPIQSLRIVSV